MSLPGHILTWVCSQDGQEYITHYHIRGSRSAEIYLKALI